MFTPLGLNHTHNTCAATNHLLDIPQRQTTHYGTYSITSIASSTWNDLQRNTFQTSENAKLMNSKISYSKHTLLSTATNLQLFCFGTILPRPYIQPSLIDFVFFFLFFLFFFLSLLLLSFLFLHYIFFFFHF